MAGILKMAVGGAIAESTTGMPKWHDEMCDCCNDTGICCQSICCLPCTMANIFNKRETGFAQCDCCGFCTSAIMLYATNGHFLQWLSFALRRELIQRYFIQGETQCGSCGRSACCPICVFCQVQREMGKRNEHAEGCCATAPPVTSLGGMIGDKLKMTAGAMLNTGGNLPHFWTTGLCECGGGECVEGCCCPCCTLGYVGNKIDGDRVLGLQSLMVVDVMDAASCCGSLWFMQGWIYAFRREAIERYSIQGESHCMTFIKTMFCPCCALLQARREMGACSEWPGGLIVKVSPVPPRNSILPTAPSFLPKF